MVIYWYIFLAFFFPGIVGYGGGPAYIPLVQTELVEHYQWFTVEEFGQMLAVANTLPGPIVTKIAGLVGYQLGGVFVAFVALFATIAPSLTVMIFLLGVLYKFKDSPQVKRMTSIIRPTLAILLGVLAYQFFSSSWKGVGIIHTLILMAAGTLLLEKWKVNPTWVIVGSLVYGAIFLA
ncbi:MAG: chromate transporter [Paenibacillaceae bacterium]